jgi:hypothetical protein
MGGETDQVYLDIRKFVKDVLVSELVTQRFMLKLDSVMTTDSSWEFVRLLQKYNASK